MKIHVTTPETVSAITGCTIDPTNRAFWTASFSKIARERFFCNNPTTELAMVLPRDAYLSLRGESCWFNTGRIFASSYFWTYPQEVLNKFQTEGVKSVILGLNHPSNQGASKNLVETLLLLKGAGVETVWITNRPYVNVRDIVNSILEGFMATRRLYGRSIVSGALGRPSEIYGAITLCL